MAELRGLATDKEGHLRSDLLAEVAGICRGAAPERGVMGPHLEIMSVLLVDAGADPALVDEWVPVGQERASLRRHRES